MTTQPIRPASPVLFTTDWIEKNDKTRILALIMQGKATSRLDLIKILAIRSTTISELVAQLLEMKLLTETVGERVGRGRPKQILITNSNRLIVLTFYIVSQSIHVAGVNLAGQVLYRDQMEAPENSDNEEFSRRFRALFQKVCLQIPNGLEVAGVAFSLPGLVDTTNDQWLFAARWPQMKNLLMTTIFPDQEIHVSRAMDAELYARLSQETQSTLLLHWGFGIGMAFGLPPDQLGFGGSNFGEIGHWHIKGEYGLCHCGGQGCLETIAAYWALGPMLLGSRFSTEATEADVALLLQQCDLLSYEAIDIALDNIVTSMINLCRIFFPEKIIVSGPFVANAQLWSEFCRRFQVESKFIDLPSAILLAGQRSHDFEIFGATNPLLERHLLRLINK